MHRLHIFALPWAGKLATSGHLDFVYVLRSPAPSSPSALARELGAVAELHQARGRNGFPYYTMLVRGRPEWPGAYEKVVWAAGLRGTRWGGGRRHGSLLSQSRAALRAVQRALRRRAQAFQEARKARVRRRNMRRSPRFGSGLSELGGRSIVGARGRAIAFQDRRVRFLGRVSCIRGRLLLAAQSNYFSDGPLRP